MIMQTQKQKRFLKSEPIQEVLFYFLEKQQMVKFPEKWVTLTASSAWACAYVQTYVMPIIYRRLKFENNFD